MRQVVVMLMIGWTAFCGWARDPDPKIRAQLLEYAAWTTREYRSWRTFGPRTDEVIPAIASALADSDDSSAAEIALIELGMRSMPVVLPLLADQNSAISEGAESVLSHLAVDDETVPGETVAQAADRIREVRSALVATLKAPSKRARYHAA